MQRRVEKKNTFIRIVVAAAFFSAGLVCEVASAFPGSLGLTPDLPDINTLGGVDLNYNAASATITAVNRLPMLSFVGAGGGFQVIGSATYNLYASLDSANNYALDTGEVRISGDLGLGAGVESLLTANIVDFGVAGSVAGSGVGEGVFEFLLNITSSNSALGFGAHAGVIIASSNLTGAALTALTGGQSFSGVGSSDTFNVVPEPSSMLLLLIGLAGISIRQLAQSRAGRHAGHLTANA